MKQNIKNCKKKKKIYFCIKFLICKIYRKKIYGDLMKSKENSLIYC